MTYWYSLFFLSVAWNSLIFYTYSPSAWGYVFVTLGVLFIHPYPNEKNICRSSADNWLAVSCAFALAFLLPLPYKVGPLFIGVGSLLLQTRMKNISKYAGKLLSLGLVFLIQGVVIVFLEPLMARYHRIYGLSDLLALGFQLLGYSSVASGPSVWIQDLFQVWECSITLEKFGIHIPVLIAAADLFLCFLYSSSSLGKRIVHLILVILVYALIRFLVLVLFSVQIEHPIAFWSPQFTAVSYSLLPLFLHKQFPVLWNHREKTQSQSTRNWFRFWEVGFGLGVLLTVLAFVGADLGIQKEGRVLVDAYHSDWEKMDRPFDTEWFGLDSEYNYYSFYQCLSSYFHTELSEQKITSDWLHQKDVFIIKIPTKPFDPEEIDALESFVLNGGGLCLIGDHTNVFGSTTYLNPIVERFGMEFRMDATYDLVSGGLSLYEPPHLFPHPIVSRLDGFLFGTSCSLRVNLLGHSVMTGYGLRAADLDYGEPNFFSKETYDMKTDYGFFSQLGVCHFGKGRVVAFTDSTVFSNFWMHIPGKPELLLGMVNWLNRINLFFGLRITLGIAGVLIVFASWFISRRWNIPIDVLRLFSISSIGFVLAFLSYSTLVTLEYPVVTPIKKGKIVGFDMEYSHPLLPIRSLVKDSPEKSFHSLYLLPQRLSFVPIADRSLDRLLDTADALVFIHPNKDVFSKYQDKLHSYLREGGGIWLLSGMTEDRNSLQRFIQQYSLTLGEDRVSIDGIMLANHEISFPIERIFPIFGGEPIVRVKSGESIASRIKVGKGTLYVCSAPSLFSDRGIGQSGSQVSRNEKEIIDLGFRIFRNLAGLEE